MNLELVVDVTVTSRTHPSSTTGSSNRTAPPLCTAAHCGRKRRSAVGAMVPRTMMASAAAVVLASLLSEAGAFTSSVSPARQASSLSESFGDALQDTFSKLSFGKQSVPEPSITPLPPPPFQPTPEGVIQRAKLLLSCDLGVQDESLLDPSFSWIGPSLGSKALKKIDYLAAGKFFDLRSTFPDLDYRAHDFRIDEQNPMTIRVTARVVGTMRGELRLRNEVLPPNGKQMRCPPEAISMTFDEKTGRLLKLCSGFAMDRLVGNTGGLCGVMGAATMAGSPPSEWECYPATKVVQRFFGRPDQRLDEPSAFLAPFPETVMVQLAKGIFSASMALADSYLLAPSFIYYTAYDGPIRKDEYLEKYASKISNGLEPELSYLRVDPYDPYRVWVDVRPEGTTLDGVYVDAPPQAFSFTFDDEGFCTRLTAGAVMDPSVGNTGGLCGYDGEEYAAGKPGPGIATRPLPQVLDRLRKLVLSPITKIDVDDYGIAPSEDLTPVARTAPSPVDKLQAKRPSSPLQAMTKAPEEKEEAPPQKRPTLSIPTFSFPAATPKASEKPKEAPRKKRPTLRIPSYAFSPPSSSTKTGSLDAAAAEKRQKAEAAAIAAKTKAENAANARQARAEAAEAERALNAKAVAQAAVLRALEAEQEKKAKTAAERNAASERKAKELAAAKAKIAAEKKVASEKRAEEAAAARIAQRQKALEATKQREAEVAAEREVTAKKRVQEAEVAKKARAAAIKAAAPRPSLSLLGLGGPSPSKPVPKKKTAPKTSSAPRPSLSLLGLGGPSSSAPSPRPSLSLLGLGGPSASRPMSKKTAPPAPAPRPSISLLGSGGPSPSKLVPMTAAPRPAPPLSGPRPSISLLGFGGPSASKPVLKATVPKPAPPAPSPRSTLSLLGLGDPSPSKEPLRPAPSPRPSLSLLGLGGPSPSKSAPPRPAPPARSPRPTLSLFGLGGPTAPAQKEVAPAPEPVPARRSTISLFRSVGRAAAKSKRAPNKKESTPPPLPRASISLLGGVKKSRSPTTSAPYGVPSFQKWKRNQDGSVTGNVFGSPAFEEGRKVTTSPISSGDIKPGSVVKTSSGTRYFLT